jgi:tellurite resistance protein TerC
MHEFLPFLAAISWPTGAQIAEAIPVILSLMLIEGLLSVDNALAIAAMARHLPEKQKELTMTLGFAGAYLFRIVALFCASYIVGNIWLKIAGAAYLIYLMCEHFTGAGDEDDDQKPDTPETRGFFATVVAIGLMDLSLSVDNVVAAVAMSPKLWVVCTGVMMGIIALRFLAGICMRMIEKHPILEETAFLLIGYVGAILVFELATHIEIHSLGKFIGIVIITTATLLYARYPRLQAAVKPVLKVLNFPASLFAALMGGVIKLIVLPFRVVLGPLFALLKSRRA